MEFLVDITVQLPHELDATAREELIVAERERGRELLAAGVIGGIWRVPGALRNISIWHAADATELHELLGSLPSYRFTRIEVIALADHPLCGGPEVG